MIASHIEQLAAQLQELGIRQAFGLVGSGTSMQLVCALQTCGIPYYPVAHEAAAALMAGACSRQGQPRAVAISIKGPGFVNFLPGMLANHYENRPALTISEAYVPGTSLARKHKRADHQSLCASLVKGFAVWSQDQDLLPYLFRCASSEVPGPVHLDICNEPGSYQVPSWTLRPSQEDPALEERILQCIRQAQRPALILGSVVSRQLAQLDWQALQIPVVTTAAAKGCMPEDSPFAAGVITGELKTWAPEVAILQEADLLVGVGLRNTEVVRSRPFQAPLILVDNIQADLHVGFEPQHDLLTSNLKTTAERLLQVLATKNWGGELVSTYRARREEFLLQDPWLPAIVFRETQRLVGPEAVLILDTGLFCTIGETIWQARRPAHFCGSSQGRFMGTAIPTAIGVALDSPGVRVVCVVGDGGLQPYLLEIKLAVTHKLPILFMLMSDGQYGTIAMGWHQREAYQSAYQCNEVNWWRCVQAMGCAATKISDTNELEKALCLWRVQEGPLFLELPFDPNKYMQMTAELR